MSSGPKQRLGGRDPQKVAGEILSYFLRNPQAADNLEGIARWRLLSEAIHRTVEDTRSALEWLVKQDVIVKRSTGSEPLFSLNRKNEAQAEALLEEIHQKRP